MDLWGKLTGTVFLELTSAEPEQVLAAAGEMGIELNSIQKKTEITITFSIAKHNLHTLKKLCERRGCSLKILRENGFFGYTAGLIRRPILVSGMLLLLLLTMFLPEHILFLKVEGNHLVPTSVILNEARNNGMHFGAHSRSVRSEAVKNALLSAIPELQWLGVNTQGCVAVISVRERVEADDAVPGKHVGSIVASRDGYVLSGTVIRGNGLFQVGQAVTEGQTLISGYTDCGIYIQAVRAEGEVFAQTTREIDVVFPANWFAKRGEERDTRRYSLLFGKKRINLWKGSGILGVGCGRMYKEYYLSLPGGFQLPVALCVESSIAFETEEFDISEAEAQEYLSACAESYLLGQMNAGEILQKEENLTLSGGVYHFRGSYVCKEMIGRERMEQIGEINGKNA